MSERQICPSSEHCYCENLTVNDQPHVKCCNCGHQQSRAKVSADLAESVPVSYAFGPGAAQTHVGTAGSTDYEPRYIVSGYYEPRYIISDGNVWKNRYEAQ